MVPSLRSQEMMCVRMAWRTRLETKVSSREQSSLTRRPPTCVQHCQAGCLYYGTLEELGAKVDKRKVALFT